MLTPALLSPDRGKHWLQTQVQQLLVASVFLLVTLRSADDASCYWGTDLETSTTLYVRLAGDPEPKVLRFNRALLYDCDAGRYVRQQQAMMFIRRTLKKMGLLST